MMSILQRKFSLALQRILKKYSQAAVKQVQQQWSRYEVDSRGDQSKAAINFTVEDAEAIVTAAIVATVCAMLGSLMEKSLRQKLIPFSLSAAVIILDQITKALIVKNIPIYTIGFSFAGDFLRIIHVANKGVAFSLGSGLSQNFRAVLFSLAPLIVIAIVIAVYFRNQDFTRLQRWCVCGIVGGGVGNIIDRIFRPQGVVDFIDVKFYGIFGLERWPTFNVADSAIVV